MSTSIRISKRTRQACEPCRRKKNKCPGNKPICSHCARLGQGRACTYGPERMRQSSVPSDGDLDGNGAPAGLSVIGTIDTSSRLRALETQLAELQHSLSNNQPWNSSVRETTSQSRSAIPFDSGSPPPLDTVGSVQLPVWSVVLAAAKSYLKYCDCQPLPLFAPHSWLVSLKNRDREVLFSILALASRFEISLSEYKGVAETAVDLVMGRIHKGIVELSTIQTLCVLSLLKFYDGDGSRASTYISLATSLAHSAGLVYEASGIVQQDMYEERRRCFWSVSILNNFCPFPFGNFSFTTHDNIPRYPASADAPLGSSSDITDPALEQTTAGCELQHPLDLGIVAYAIKLSDVWQRALRFARRRGKAGTVPDWSSQSEYSGITAQLMEFETTMPWKYRFKPSRFSEQHPEDLERNRAFWCPWLLVQMLYHSTLCLLNHPLLLSLRLRNFRVTLVPEVYLQQTADLISTHTHWVVYLLDLAKQKDFTLTDPSLAHCVGVAATIYLQQSFTTDPTVRKIKQENFQKCTGFLHDLGKFWPYITRLALKLHDFEKVVSSSFQDSATNSATDRSITIDLNLFWEIIESSFTTHQSSSSNSFFGPSLALNRPASRIKDILRSRPLPEPTRLNTEALNSIAPNSGAPLDFSPADSFDQSGIANLGLPLDEEFFVPAQNYFAQGQDFVGNMNDWWFSTRTDLA